MKVNLLLAEPNPFRDFKVDPVDPANVAQLRKSIKDHGFWGGMVGRRKPGARGVFEIIAGWHRREAALKAGIEEAEIYVGEFNDQQAIRAYAAENATQRGNTSTALAGSVAAAVRLILLRELSLVASTSERHGAQKRDGVGRDAIVKELDGVFGINDNVVRVQLANIKSSGAYDRIVREVTALVEGEQAAELEALAAAERAREVAERREAEAKARREQAEEDKRKAREERDRREAEAKAARDAEAKKRAEQARRDAEKRQAEAEERRKKAVAQQATAKEAATAARATEAKHGPTAKTRESIAKMREQPKHDITFDMAGVSKQFKHPSHVETFRRLAVKNAAFLPVDRQADLAKRIVEAASGHERAEQYRGEVSSDFIEQEFLGLLSMAKATKHDLDAKDRKAREAELRILAWSEKAKGLQTKVNQYAISLRKAVADLAYLERSRPEGASVLWTQSFETGVTAIRAALEQIEDDLGYRPAKKSEPVQASRKALK